MTSMRYYAADLLSPYTVRTELPLYGVYMDKVLSGSGNFTGTFVLDTGIDDDPSLLAGSNPGVQALYVERDGVPIWGGPIWSRTYQASSKTVQLTAQTFESVFERCLLLSDLVWTSVDQVTIITAVLSTLQAQFNNNFGLTGSYPSPAGTVRSISMLAAENRFFKEILDALSNATNGLDYTVNAVSYSAKTFKVLTQVSPASSGMVFEYPGQIASYWHSESGSRGAVRSIATGQGVSAVSAHANYLTLPNFWQAGQYPDITDGNLIQQKANDLIVMPFVSPTFELDNGDDFQDGWDRLGQTFQANVRDPRFPDGKLFTSRLTGWSYTPESSESGEDLKFMLETDS